MKKLVVTLSGYRCTSVNQIRSNCFPVNQWVVHRCQRRGLCLIWFFYWSWEWIRCDVRQSVSV